MTKDTKLATYLSLGIVGLFVAVAVLAYVVGWFDPAATGTS